MRVLISQRESDSEFPPAPPTTMATTTTQTLPPIDLKHMTSSGALSPGPSRTDARRTSQHLHPRSPSSIPSSPTSVHSSSSAIFERDIEPLGPPSPPHALSPASVTGPYHPPNPHRIPRATRTEALEHSVPSVLDSAAAVLGSLAADGDTIAVVAPAPFDFLGASSGAAMGLGLTFGGRTSGFASPIGSFRSRSPSPSPRAEVIFAAGASAHAHAQSQPTAQSVLGLQGLAPLAAPPTVSASISGSRTGSRSASGSGSPAQPGLTLTQRSPSTSPRPLAPSALLSAPSSSPPSPTASPRREPASPASASHASKRLSFMSYADLRASTPATTTSLTQLTSGASTEPPPHITGVNGITLGTSVGGGSAWGGSERGGSAAPSVHGLSIGSGLGLSIVPPPAAVPSLASYSLVASPPSPASAHPHGQVHVVSVVGPHAPHTLPLLDVGGEWAREGLGRGLEERLEGEVTVGGGGSMEEVGV